MYATPIYVHISKASGYLRLSFIATKQTQQHLYSHLTCSS